MCAAFCLLFGCFSFSRSLLFVLCSVLALLRCCKVVSDLGSVIILRLFEHQICGQRQLVGVTKDFLSSILGENITSFTQQPAVIQGNCSSVHVFTVNIDITDVKEKSDNGTEYQGSSSVSSSQQEKVLYFKFPLPDSPDRNVAGNVNRDLLVNIAAYRKEIGLYRAVITNALPSLKDVLPPIYYAEIDSSSSEAKDDFLLVMGSAGQGLDQLQGCSFDVSKQAVAQLARLQAPFVNVGEKARSSSDSDNGSEGDNLFHRLGLDDCLHTPTSALICRVLGKEQDFREESNHSLISHERLLQYCLDEFDCKYQDFSIVMQAIGDKGICDNLLPKVSEIIPKAFACCLKKAFDVAFIHPSFKTLVHGDFKLDNLLWDSKTNQVRILDFQALCYGHPCYDLAQFIVQSHDSIDQPVPSSESNVPLVDELIEVYFQSMCQHYPGFADRVTTLDVLKESVKSVFIFQLMLITFFVAPLRGAIDAETGKLPDTFGRFLPLLVMITQRGLKAFLLQARME